MDSPVDDLRSVTLRCERSEPTKSAIADLDFENTKSGKPDFAGATARAVHP
jgi:hypothetical protein